MNFGFDERERAWRDEVRAFVETIDGDRVLELRREMDELDIERHAVTFYRELCDRGWVGLAFPEPWGRGATVTERMIIHEELDAAALPLWGMETSEAIGWMLVRSGPPELAEIHLPRILDGSWQYSGAYSEPQAGSDLLALSTRAERRGEVYVVNGAKLWTSSAHLADWIFAIVRTDPASRRHHGLSMLLIDTASPGVDVQPVRVMGGWRVNAVFFEDVEVPVGNLVGQEHEGWSVLATALNEERSMSFGGREARLFLTRVLHRFAGHTDELAPRDLEAIGRLATELEVDRLLNLRVAAMAERGLPPAAESSMSKVFGSELAQDVAAWLTDLFGTSAQVPDAADTLVADAELFQHTATVLTIIGGTSEVQRNIVATQGLGLPKGF